ncbi:MAG: MBL fold metallo-hydrolase [Deinococcales bacterium]|nr:MBL fold metallo-hydrolase [Chitinophagaceae bacterium]
MIHTKNISLLLICFLLFSCRVLNKTTTNLNAVQWAHGSENCKENKDAAIQIVRYNANTFILRQNKCTNYEAPFMFLFLGKEKALLMDTGATEDPDKFPLYATVKKIIEQWEQTNNTTIELIVAHTHNHGDHKAGDAQFKNKKNVVLLGLEVEDVTSYFKITNWPLTNATIDLGNRELTIIPIPGHQKASIAVYDNETNILLTGDSFYPGRLYIKEWEAYALSIQRLVDFTAQHKITYILGNHIEMSKTPKKDYPTGTTFQPDEQPLPLTVKNLLLLNKALKKIGTIPSKKVCDYFIIYPV